MSIESTLEVMNLSKRSVESRQAARNKLGDKAQADDHWKLTVVTLIPDLLSLRLLRLLLLDDVSNFF
jgi:hypothetical protein